jgi:hypothetical protein
VRRASATSRSIVAKRSARANREGISAEPSLTRAIDAIAAGPIRSAIARSTAISGCGR